MDTQLTGARALVTAASSGLGLACARSLLREGAEVVISARRTARLETARENVGATAAIGCDLDRPDEIERAVAESVEILGGLDVLVVNSAPPPVGLFSAASDHDWESGFVGVTMSAVRLIRNAIPHLRRSQRGRIVVLTGYGFREPQSALVVSEASRAGVALLAKVIANDYAVDGITVNNIAPGPVLTDRLRQIHRATAEQNGLDVDDVIARSAEAVPVGRFGYAGEIGDLCAYLCSEQAGFITGQTIVVDGGINRAI